jgi:O-acetylhomoserine (thiol)-lyase
MERKKRGFETRAIHGKSPKESWLGATQPPIFQSAAHTHETAESLSLAFAGKSSDPIYMRLSNPTNQALEERLADLEEGKGAIVMASGMAAISNACMALLRTGDEFVSGNSLFMSTYVLFSTIFKKYGITARFADPLDLAALKASITEKTRFVYVETIGNPRMDVPDLKAIASLAHENGLPLLVDNTLATPFLCQPLTLGADVVIHSTTKYLSGHGNALGGAVVDGGTFSWPESRFPDFKPFIDRKGDLAYLDKVFREHHINFGTTLSPFHSYLTLIGIDTLSLRMERHLENALATARFLKTRPQVKWVNYSGLDDHPSHETALRQFGGKGFGGLITFGLENKEACFRFIDSLELIRHLANLGDCKSLVIHPYSTQYLSFDEALKAKLAILPEMIRLSVGIEAKEDIFEDIERGLAASAP